MFLTLAAVTVLAFLPDYSALPEAASFNDLLNHAAAFMVLYLLCRLSYALTPMQITSFLFPYAMAIEIVQTFLPTRFASLEDLVADALGVSIGYLAARLLPTREKMG